MGRSYLTVSGTTENKTEIRRSKFITTLAGISDGESAEEFVRTIKRRYPDATHNCYAYIADERGTKTRFSDDGEPSGTAGQPMLEVLKKRGLVKAAVVVTRYFGGIKLGAGGLVGAYTDGVSQAIDKAAVVRMTECDEITFECSYAEFPSLESALKKAGAKTDDVVYGEGVRATFLAGTDNTEAAIAAVCAASGGRVTAKAAGKRFAVLE